MVKIRSTSMTVPNSNCENQTFHYTNGHRYFLGPLLIFVRFTAFKSVKEISFKICENFYCIKLQSLARYKDVQDSLKFARKRNDCS